jgi:hypothetical protein
MRRTIIQAAVAGLVVALNTSSALAQIAPLPRLVLQCSQRTPLTLRLTVQNDGGEPTAVVIGGILANDRKYLLGSLAFVLHRDRGADATVQYVDPNFNGIVGGRVDDWLVALPPSSAYSVVLPMSEALRRNFSQSADVSARLAALPHSEHSSSDLAGQRFVHLWTGTLVSESVRIPASCPARRD